MQQRACADQAVLSPDCNRGQQQFSVPEIFDAGRGSVVNRHTDTSTVRDDGFNGRPYDRDVVADAGIRVKAEAVREMRAGVCVGRCRHVCRLYVPAVRSYRPGHRAPAAVAVPGRHHGEDGRQGGGNNAARIQHIGHRQSGSEAQTGRPDRRESARRQPQNVRRWRPQGHRHRHQETAGWPCSFRFLLSQCVTSILRLVGQSSTEGFADFFMGTQKNFLSSHKIFVGGPWEV